VAHPGTARRGHVKHELLVSCKAGNDDIQEVKVTIAFNGRRGTEDVRDARGAVTSSEMFRRRTSLPVRGRTVGCRRRHDTGWTRLAVDFLTMHNSNLTPTDKTRGSSLVSS